MVSMLNVIPWIDYTDLCTVLMGVYKGMND